MFDLLCVGGTGQWFLLNALRTRADALRDHLDRAWIVDADDGPLFRTLVRELKVFKDFDGGDILYRPLGLGGGTTVASVGGGWGQPRLLDLGLTVEELELVVDDGFFAFPRASAVYVSARGFEDGGPALDPDSKFPQALNAAAGVPHPLVLVHSVAGGTGGGLGPALLRVARPDDTARWTRSLITVPIFPWFNPERALRGRAGGANVVPWERKCGNAERGALLLDSAVQDFRLLAEGSPPNVFTVFLPAGPRPSLVEEESRLPDATPDQWEQGAADLPSFLSDIFDAVVDSCQKYTTMLDDHTLVPGGDMVAVCAPVTEGHDGDGGGGDSVARNVREAFVGARLRELAKELSDRFMDCFALGGLRSSRFGKLLGVLADGLYGTTSDRRRKFLDSLGTALEKAAGTGDNSRLATSVARDLELTVQSLDLLGADTARDFFAWGDMSPEVSEQDINKRANNAASRIKRYIQQSVNMCKVVNGKVEGFGTLPELAKYRLLPVGGESDGVEEKHDILRDPENVFDGIAEVYEMAAGPRGNDLGSRHWASYLSGSHALAHDVGEGEEAAQRFLDTYRHVEILWCAGVAGLLEFSSLGEPELKAVKRTESITASFGGDLRCVSFKGTPLGYTSADLGFVPHVALVERPDEAGNLAVHDKVQELNRVLQTEVRGGVTLKQRCQQLLRKFGEKHAGGLAPPQRVPWASLLVVFPAGEGLALDGMIDGPELPLRPPGDKEGAPTLMKLPSAVSSNFFDAVRSNCNSEDLGGGTTRLLNMGSDLLDFNHDGQQTQLVRAVWTGEHGIAACYRGLPPEVL